jgi:beta-phosphoglucomutase-like phosphatase (HAD superfamily)
LKIFSCTDLGKGKEEPDIFLLASEFLGEKTEETWVFEDSLTAIETVSRIGMPTVGIYDPYNYGQDRIKEIATEYVAAGETLLKLTQ